MAPGMRAWPDRATSAVPELADEVGAGDWPAAEEPDLVVELGLPEGAVLYSGVEYCGALFWATIWSLDRCLQLREAGVSHGNVRAQDVAPVERPVRVVVGCDVRWRGRP